MKVAEDRNFYVKREATHWLLKKKNTNISFGSTPFSSQPVVITSWSSAGSYGSGNFGAIKVTSVSTSGFNAVIGGSTPSSGVISWIAIGT